jgi:hypothetical protein
MKKIRIHSIVGSLAIADDSDLDWEPFGVVDSLDATIIKIFG